MEQFHVVKVQPVHKAYAASSGVEQIEMQVVGTLEIFTDLGEALNYREDMNGLCEKLKHLGVQFSAQYQFEIQQVVSKPGLGGTRKRLLDLSGHEGNTVDDAYFGGTVEELIIRTLRDKNIHELENNLGIHDDDE
jgi:hypothetical protein